MTPPVARAAALLLVAATLSAGPLRAQADPLGPWLPVGSRADRNVRWAIDAGALQLNPLVRPFRLAAVRAALATAQSRGLPERPARTLEAVARDLRALDDSAALLVEGSLAAYHNARRETLRSGGGSGVSPGIGVWASASTGPFVAVLNPAIEGRLRDDPEFTGEKTKRVTGRIQTAYLAATGRTGDVILGRLTRTWGPDLFDGLMLSGSAYAFDELAAALRVGRFELTSLTRRLSSVADTSGSGVAFNRFFLAHRLDMRIRDDTWLGLIETAVYGGSGDTWHPALLVPINLAIASAFNDSIRMNSMLGAELSMPLARGIRFEGSLMVDDIQIDRKLLTDKRPAAYGLTLVLRGAWPGTPVHSALGYTRVSALAYRNSFDPDFEYSNQHVGLARNFSDYDQVLLRTQLRPLSTWDIVLDLAYFRQGSADFRQPFPNDSVLAGPNQGFLVAPVRRWVAGRILADAEIRPGFTLTSELGFTAAPAGGTTAIASFAARLAFDVLHRRAGAAYSGGERGADRPWP